jgi:predicted DNA-binding transcriptional regulator AlpA
MIVKAVVSFKRLKSDYGVVYSRTHLDRMEKLRKFPSSFKLSDHRNSPRVYWAHEIAEWLEGRARASSAGS